ncbi:MAG: hypothetical protein K2P17_02870 [Helicobacteraceae bacterium]|nr:hypothetical protein [Helicobacteraceae bacterium]
MFSRVESKFFGTYSLKKSLEKTKINVEKRVSQIDFNTLGKSLSCNPYMPRTTLNHLILKENLYYLSSFEVSNFESLNADFASINNKYSAVLANTTLQNEISLISNLRRYSPYLIIHKDIIISKYQVLESLVYGADMIILANCILHKDSFFILAEYAKHLGLEVASLIDNKESLGISLESNINIFITQDSTIIDSIPHNKALIILK